MNLMNVCQKGFRYVEKVNSKVIGGYLQKEKKKKLYLGQASCSDLNEHAALLIFEKFTEI